MKKMKQLFIIALCLTLVVAPVPTVGDDGVATCGHFWEERNPN